MAPPVGHYYSTVDCLAPGLLRLRSREMASSSGEYEQNLDVAQDEQKWVKVSDFCDRVQMEPEEFERMHGYTKQQQKHLRVHRIVPLGTSAVPNPFGANFEVLAAIRDDGTEVEVADIPGLCE